MCLWLENGVEEGGRRIGGDGRAGGWERNPASAGSPPPPPRVWRGARFQAADGLRGRFRRPIPGIGPGAPRPFADGAGRREGWLSSTGRRMGPESGTEEGVRRHHDGASLGGRCGRLTDRGFLGKNPSFSLGFPGRGLGFRKTKTPLPGGSGLRMRVLLAPQFFHFPCAPAARFVVVTWVICQEATACRRTKARGQPIWEAGADMVCCVQFMEFVIARSVPAMCGR